MARSSYPWSRRDAMRLTVAGGLSFLLPALDARAADKRGQDRPRSLIMLWLDGGPSQLETWDPHPGGPANIIAPVKAIPTTIPDVQIAEFFPQVAEQLHRVSVIRSVTSIETSHQRAVHAVKTGHLRLPDLTYPSIGAVLAHQLPAVDITLPPYLSLAGMPRSAEGGYLGHQYDAFKVHEPGKPLANVKSELPSDRQQRRRNNLDFLTRSFQKGREAASESTTYRSAVESAQRLMDSTQLDAFQIGAESQAIRRAYGDHEFGRGCLVARRLVERGVRAVEVTLGGWDSHVENLEKHRGQAGVLDPALSTLLTDLAERDLLQSTVVLCIGEFGRTPKINAQDGRDHWPYGFSCLVGGGGIESGRLIGATDPVAESREPQDPVSLPDLHATILSAIGVEYRKQLATPQGEKITICNGTPLDRLLID